MSELKIGDMVHAKLPGHGVLWNKEHGWHQHVEIHDGAGRRTEMHRGTPANGKARVVAVNPDGTLDLELPGHHTNEIGHRRGPGTPYDEHGHARAEIVPNVPPLERAETYCEAKPNDLFAGRYQHGPHFVMPSAEEFARLALLREQRESHLK